MIGDLKASLIVASLGRTNEVERLFRSLDRQSYRNFEVIVVDQNPDRRLWKLAGDYAALDIIYLTGPPGLSRARNQGLNKASGDIVAFPDDDCQYPDELIATVISWFLQHPGWGLLSGRTADQAGGSTAARFDRSAGPIHKGNVFRRANSTSMFVRWRGSVTSLRFDEALGLGSGTPWGSGEDTDFLLKAMDHGSAAWYEPSIAVLHPSTKPDGVGDGRGFAYGCGMGRVMRTHRFPPHAKLSSLARPLGGTLLEWLRGNKAHARYHFSVFRGRALGLGWNAGVPSPMKERDRSA